MKKQVCVRTYPYDYTRPMSCINEYLEKGYTVVICNSFDLPDGKHGNEYILEKEVSENDERGSY